MEILCDSNIGCVFAFEEMSPCARNDAVVFAPEVSILWKYVFLSKGSW